VTEEARPCAQRFALGGVETATSLALPQRPFIAESLSGAEQAALEPPLVPVQLQRNGPTPVTEEALPVAHRFELGVEVDESPFPLPHVPFTGGSLSGAEQDAFAPPLVPLQLQRNGPTPITEEVLPVAQRFELGAEDDESPFALPQVPMVGIGKSGAEHEAFEPPSPPAHVQLKEATPVTAEAVPIAQRFVLGELAAAAPLAEPQLPLTGAGGAIEFEIVRLVTDIPPTSV
jgi:hypothetical protein